MLIDINKVLGPVPLLFNDHISVLFDLYYVKFFYNTLSIVKKFSLSKPKIIRNFVISNSGNRP
jgi:hypothetical protein